MIPLNKPKIFQKLSNQKFKSVKNVLYDIYANKNIEIVFSARQGLDIIYSKLYKEKGVCKVAVSPLTCFDALYPIIKNKHKIVFVDVNPDTFNMDEEKIPYGIDIIQSIHFGGNPQNMNLISKKAKINSALIIEDCAQAFGSTYKNIRVGEFGDYAVFSFVKNLYALGGGFIISKDKLKTPTFIESSLNIVNYRTLKRFLESKNSFNTFFYKFALLNLLRLKPSDTSYVFSKNSIHKKMHHSIEIQLSNHEKLIESRKEIAHRIRSEINNKNLIEQKNQKNGESIYTRLLYKLKKGSATEYIHILREKNIWANHLSQSTLSNYQQSVFEAKDFKKFANLNSLRQYKIIHDKIISIPISPSLQDKEINYMVFHINNL